MQSAVSRVDEAAVRILKEVPEDSSNYGDLAAYINVLRTMITGNYYWR